MKGKEKREDAWLFLLLTFFCVGSFPKQRVVIKHTPQSESLARTVVQMFHPGVPSEKQNQQKSFFSPLPFLPSAIGRAKIEKKNVSPRSPPFLSHLQIKPSGSGDENVANIFRLFFSLSSRFPFAFLFIASMKSWLASISYKGTNLICKISSIFSPNVVCL